MNRFSKITVSQISRWVGLDEKETWVFARTLDDQFLPTRQIVINGKARSIDAPNCSTKKRLRKLHRAIQRQTLLHGAAHGGVKGKSIFTSAGKHTGTSFIWTRDAKDCFPSVTGRSMNRELKRLGFATDVARLLTYLFVIRGAIPQGSPLSNDALNLYFYRLDQFAASRAGQIGFSFSRVADDFVLSGNTKAIGDALIRRIEERIGDHGLIINDKKRRNQGLQPGSNAQYVHNLLVNTRGSVRPNKDHKQIAIELAAKYVNMAQRVDAYSIPATADVRCRLQGYYYFLKQSDKSPHKWIKQQLVLGDQKVMQKLEKIGLTSPKGKWWLITRCGKRIKNEPLRLASIWKRILAAA
ncbi:MAG: reverse transcriptase domain-containing protein [Planctomycetaceae bacterium]